MTIRRASSIIYLLLLWVPTLLILELEWRFNEQYHYGYFVPLFTLYLVYNRWMDRPTPAETKPSLFGIGFGFILTLLFIPLQLIKTANPDWRLIYWSFTIVSLAGTLWVVNQSGGKSWLRHFSPALLMILFAVPWITRIENTVTGDLMRIVAAVTVEVVNLSGIYAVKMGNVIQLPDAVVGIEEACSGVRSLQSSLMAGYLFGEILNLRVYLRLILIFAGIALTFLLNLFRTISLTLITHAQGNEGYEQWHDTLGNSIAIVGFIGVALLAWLLSRVRNSRSASEQSTNSSFREILPSTTITTSLSTILLLSLVINHFWYDTAQKNDQSKQFPTIKWENIDEELHAIEINPITKAQLKYSEGNHFAWRSFKGPIWTAFYFKWDAGLISSHAGVHRPENCLPSSGLKMVGTHDDFIWESKNDIKIPFRTLIFKNYNQEVIVFFAVWDENGGEPWLSASWADRIKDVWLKRIVNGRHSLEFIADGYNGDIESAKKHLAEYLDRLYQM